MRFNLYQLFVETLSKEIADFSNKKYLLAVSGGMDSMVMWDLFTRAGLQVVVAHVNFLLRGKESNLDEELVRKTAQERNHSIFVHRVDTQSYAQDKGLSIQMAAREIRYQFFREILLQENADFICTAHHLDDLAETFFIGINQKANLFKLVGTNKIYQNLYRPLLNFTKQELEYYAFQNKISFREDRSNQKNIYQRNIWRNVILPDIENYFPDFRKNFYQTISHLQETSSFLKHTLESLFPIFMIDEQTLDLAKLKTHPHAHWILKQFLLSYDADPSYAEKMLSHSSKPRVFYSEKYIFYVHYHYLHVENRKDLEEEENQELYYIDEDLNTKHIPFYLRASHITIHDLNDIPEDTSTACMDVNKLQFPLLVRRWKPGDYFQPYGMKGQKKVSDFLTDLKIPVWIRKKIYVMISGERIVWVMGYRISQHVAIQAVPAKAILWNFKNI